MILKIISFVFIVHLQWCSVEGWSIVTSRPVIDEQPRLLTWEEVIDRQIVYRLNDPEMGLTAHKDGSLKSCFVNDYDPYWTPAPADKEELLKSQPCEKVNDSIDYGKLKKKAGPKIARMCKELYIIWLASRNIAPPPLPGMDVPVQQRGPCPVIYDDDIASSHDMNSEGSNGGSRGNAAQPLVQGRASYTQQPPIIGGREQNSFENGAPPRIDDQKPPLSGYEAPPRQYNGQSSMMRDGGPPMMQNGAPPMMHRDGAPSMIDDGAPPMIDDGAPPMMDGAPPMMDGAPPMMDGAPLMQHDGAPPMRDDGPPPMMKESEMGPPPLMQGFNPKYNTAEEIPPTIKAPMFRRMLGAIKNKSTIAPPTPDMKTPPPPRALYPRNI